MYLSASSQIGRVNDYKQCLYEQVRSYFVGCNSGTVTFDQIKRPLLMTWDFFDPVISQGKKLKLLYKNVLRNWLHC